MTTTIESPVRKVNYLVDDIERTLYEIENGVSTHNELLGLFSRISNDLSELVRMYESKNALVRVSKAYEKFYEEGRIKTGISELDTYLSSKGFNYDLGYPDSLTYDEKVYKAANYLLTSYLPDFIRGYNIEILSFIKKYGNVVSAEEICNDPQTRTVLSLIRRSVELYRTREHLTPIKPKKVSSTTYEYTSSNSYRQGKEDHTAAALGILGTLGLLGLFSYGVYKAGMWAIENKDFLMDHIEWIILGGVILFALLSGD